MTMISMRFDDNKELIKEISPFVGKYFDEDFDGDKLAVLCENSLPLDNLRRKDARNQVILKKYLDQKYTLQMFKAVKTKHRTGYEQNEDLCTRVQADSSSAQGMLREARHFIFNDSYEDFDMVNAHPRIILRLCRELDIPSPALNKYVSSREYILSECQKSGKSREHYKTLFISLMYGKSVCKIDPDENQFIFEFAKEFQCLAKKITDAFPSFKKTCIEQRKEKGKDYNHDSATLSHLCQCFEAKFLDIMFEILLLKSPKFSRKCIPCFDGLMVSKESFDEDYTAEMFIADCESKIALPEVFKIERKSMQQMHDIVSKAYKYHSSATGEHVERYLKDQRSLKIRNYRNYKKTMDQKFLHEPQTHMIDFIDEMNSEYDVWPDFDMLKEYFASRCNRYFANVLSKPGTLVCNISKKIIAEQKLPNATVSIYDRKGVSTFTLQYAAINLGLVGEVRKYNDIGCFPYSPVQESRASEDVFNTFAGLQATYKAIDKPSKNLNKILKHVFDVLSNRDEQVYDYILVWLSNIFRRPGWPTKRCIIFHSTAQQIGKGIFLNFLVDLVIGHSYAHVRKNSEFLKCAFNKELENTILNVMDEVPEMSEYADSKSVSDKFKSYITEPFLEIIAKGQTPRQTCNSNNFIVTSNDSNPIHIDPKDKRYFKVKCGEFYDGDKKYFQSLADAMSQEAADEFYSYCYDYQSKFDRHLHDQPQTESLIQSKIASQTNAVKFISHLHDLIKDGLICNGETFNEEYAIDEAFAPIVANYSDVKGKVRISSKYLYEAFEKWAKQEGIKKIVKKSNFMLEIEQCDFVKNVNIARVLHALIERD